MQLRPYQQKAIESVCAAFANGYHSCLVNLPTGTGKTILFAKLAEKAAMEGKRTLVLAHRGELLEQAIDKIRTATGMVAALEKAEATSRTGADGIPPMIVVGSVQSMCRESRLVRFRNDDFDYIVIDECHHALSWTYRAILDYFTGAHVLGVTATPDRGDMRGLCEVFETIAFDYSIVDAVRDGFLCKIKARTIPLEIDISGVETQAGDLKAGGLSNALTPYLPQIARCIPKDRKTVIFTPLIATSNKLLPYLEAEGFDVREVNGESKDRKEIIEWFNATGKGSCIINSMLLTEGWDCPSVDCVVVLRATKVRALYCQMIGRGTRISPGKEDLLVLDFLWLTSTHELCRPASLLSAVDDVKECITERTKAATQAGAEIELTGELLEEGESESVKKREDALAAKLEKMRRKQGKLIDPLQYAVSIQSAALTDYVPMTEKERHKPTAAQIEALEKESFGAPETAGEADAILKELERRRNAGLASPKQIRFLERKHFKNVGQWLFADAKRLIDRIAVNGWKTPYDINPLTYFPEK